MSLALTGMRATQVMGAAGATNLSLQLFQTQPTPQAGVATQAATTPQAGLPVGVALPAIHAMDTASVVAVNSLAAIQYPTAQDQLAQENKLTDTINVTANDLWRLAARFLANPEAFTLPLTGNKSTTDTKRAAPIHLKKHVAVKVSSQRTTKVPVEAETVDHSEPTPAKQTANTKMNAAVALMSDGIEIENVSLDLSSLPKASGAASTGSTSAQATPQQTAKLKNDTAATAATGPFKSVVPYSVAQLERARTILRTAGALGGSKAASPFTQTTTSPAILRNAPHAAAPTSKKIHASTGSGQPIQQTNRASQTFKRAHIVGRSPAFLVGNITSKKARKADPAQIVRVATGTASERRIVFARVPGTRGEYRFVGTEHQHKAIRPQERAAARALMTPHAERNFHRTALGLAPRGAGESAYTMPDPRELREDEREVLVGMIKEHLALGPASLSDSSIRERFNGFMFSNTVGEMSHYVTADQWNAMVRATILYAARTALPFSNNSIAQVAAAQLFDGTGAQARYAAWNDHFGITGMADVAMVDTFLSDDRILTMPEYFLKGIMDHLIERAPELQGYDENALPIPFTTELHLQWETIGFIHDAAISNDAQLIEAATSFAEEIAALDAQAAQHFLELVMLSTLIKTDSIQGVWTEDQAVALVRASIKAGLSDVIDPIGRNRSLPRRVRRLVAIAKESVNAAEDADNGYQLGLEKLTRNLAEAIQNGVFSIDQDESEELHAN